MGGVLSCTSINDRHKGAVDYSVTIQPSDEVDRSSQQDYIFTDDRCPPIEGEDKKILSDTMNVKNGFVLNSAEDYHKKDAQINNTSQSESNSSSWKFWRRLSARSRSDHKPVGRRDRPEIVLLEKPVPSQTPVDVSDVRIPLTTVPLSGPLPDVVEKAQAIPRFSSNSIPPPKPPRLFLIRTPSNVTKHSTDGENEPDPVYSNVSELKPQSNNTSVDPAHCDSVFKSHENAKLLKKNDTGENNNVIDNITKNGMEKDQNSSIHTTSKESSLVTFNLGPETNNLSSKMKCIPQQSALVNSMPRKPKIKTPELQKRSGRSRRRSSEKGEMTRQKHIMNSISELLRQRLDPYPLLDRLKKSGILTNVDVQSFFGHHDRKSVCEGLVSLIGDGSPDALPVFCDVLAAAGNCTEIIEVLQVMRDIDRIIHEVSYNTQTEITDLTDEKNLSYEVGYLAPDHSLKPLVELEKVRASSDKRLSKTSSRNSAYSLLEGGETESVKNSDNNLFPGLIMISVCVTGHNLSGKRAEALANVIRNNNCVCELRVGKTQLGGEDIKVICKALETNRTIHSLDLRLNSIDFTGAQAIADLLQKTKTLRFLNLSSSALDLGSIKTIAASVSSNRSLIDLDLSFLEIGDECCECLRDMLRANTSLQKIRLRSNNLTWSGCYIIAEGLVRNLSLSVFDLSRNAITDDGVQALAKFLPESSVTDICLENCGITAAGCEALAELVTHCKKLKHLDISTNSLTDAGIFKIAAAVERTSSLQNLGLNMCGISNDGFSKLLDVLEKNTSIVHMKLCFNMLGKEHSNPQATSDNLRYRLRIVTSSKPKLRILLWGNSFDES